MSGTGASSIFISFDRVELKSEFSTGLLTAQPIPKGFLFFTRMG
jgi:hypothetical protein